MITQDKDKYLMELADFRNWSIQEVEPYKTGVVRLHIWKPSTSPGAIFSHRIAYCSVELLEIAKQLGLVKEEQPG